jgi:nucleoside-diphosphate-sugar epimerase
MKALISGSAGFLGSKVLQIIPNSIAIPRVYLYRPELLNHFIKTHEPTHIFHFAAYGNHSHQKDWVAALEANVIALANLMLAVKSHQIKAFINVGSSSEYGLQYTAMSESMRPDPRTAYEGTKAAGTMLATAFARTEQMPIVTIRPFSVYG